MMHGQKKPKANTWVCRCCRRHRISLWCCFCFQTCSYTYFCFNIFRHLHKIVVKNYYMSYQSVRTEQFGCHWLDLMNLFWGLLIKYFE